MPQQLQIHQRRCGGAPVGTAETLLGALEPIEQLLALQEYTRRAGVAPERCTCAVELKTPSARLPTHLPPGELVAKHHGAAAGLGVEHALHRCGQASSTAGFPQVVEVELRGT